MYATTELKHSRINKTSACIQSNPFLVQMCKLRPRGHKSLIQDQHNPSVLVLTPNFVCIKPLPSNADTVVAPILQMGETEVQCINIKLISDKSRTWTKFQRLHAAHYSLFLLSRNARTVSPYSVLLYLPSPPLLWSPVSHLTPTWPALDSYPYGQEQKCLLEFSGVFSPTHPYQWVLRE